MRIPGIWVVSGVPEFVLVAFTFFSIVRKVIVYFLDPGRDVATLVNCARRHISVPLVGDVPGSDVVRSSAAGTAVRGVVILRCLAILGLAVVRAL